MTKLIKAFVFGSCSLHGPPYTVAPLGFFPYTIGKLGFNHAPFALTSGAALQLYDFCVGERKLSKQLRMLAYLTQNQPTADKRQLVDDTDLGFVELSSPLEPVIGDDVVNFYYIRRNIVQPLKAAGAQPKLISGWLQSLTNAREDLKERADALLANWPEDSSEKEERHDSAEPFAPGSMPVPSVNDPETRFAVQALRSRRLEVDDMVRDLELLREKLGKPMAMKLYDFTYMPDGRAIEWPAGFKAQQIEVARRMNLPTLETGPIVERFGAKTVMRDDMSGAHFTVDAYPLVAELMYDFWASILGRPYLESYPEWREAKPDLFARLPRLFDGPVRLAFPNLAQFPSTTAAGRAA